VDLFFVLSGFLITGILYDTRNTQHRFRNFYVRRTLRIFPLYYGLLIVGLLLTPIFHWIWHPVWILWPLYLGNYGRFIWLGDWMQGTGVLDHLRSSLPFKSPFFLYFGHFWSLCVEEQFYLL
jgi:peptidoglycan/LPS O-acetylase OafA/YrhL